LPIFSSGETAMNPALPIVLSVALLPAAAPADELSLSERLLIACKGWSVARLMNDTVATKQAEMIAALDAIGDGNPTAPLARAVSESLGAINAAMAEGAESAEPAWNGVCGSLDMPTAQSR